MAVLDQDLDKTAIVLGTPDLRTDHPKMWAVADADRRLPPAEDLATAESVRAWPWMCRARGLKGMVWRRAVGAPPPAGPTAETGAWDRLSSRSVEGLTTPTPRPGPLLQVSPTGQITLGLRLAWLLDGINDTGHFDLLTRRSDPAVAAEVLAGVIGRTGLGAAAGPALDPGEVADPPTGYLYAGWPADPRTWAALPGILDKLIAAGPPGSHVHLAPDDPLYLAAKMWLAQAHRLSARVAGYRFALEPSREGTLLSARADLLAENPLAAPTELEVQWKNLPGDLQLLKDAGPPQTALPGHALLRRPVRVAGHLDELPPSEQFQPIRMALGEKAGALLELPVLLPVYRMYPTREPPTLDGTRGGGTHDWPKPPTPAAEAYGPMPLAMRDLTRGNLLKGDIRTEPTAPTGSRPPAATVKWTYDSDYIYAYIDSPQPTVSDQRTSAWPVTDRRWWGTDGVQLQIAGGARLDPGVRIVQIAVKPSGTVLTKYAVVPPPAEPPAVGSPSQPIKEGGTWDRRLADQWRGGTWDRLPSRSVQEGVSPPPWDRLSSRSVEGGLALHWTDGTGDATGLRYAVISQPQSRAAGVTPGYAVQLAIPRKWWPIDHDHDPNLPCRRVNVLLHRANPDGGGITTSWSGPLIDDSDIPMMGLLVGAE